ncbi:MAG: glycoside hydrolase family 30 beta sandwich domain-containing protein [Terracidiphilus sp.]|jgi:hypothetical protein
MQETRRQTHLCLTTKNRRAVILLGGCLLGGGTSWFLGAQTVHVSVWSSEMDHSLESVLVFQSQSREAAQAYVHVFDDIQHQQIVEFNAAPSSGEAAPSPADSTASGDPQAKPTLDQVADTLIVRPLLTGAQSITAASGSVMDFLLVTQLFRAVKPKAYLIDAAATGSKDLESIAFRNPDDSTVLLTVNHAQSPISLEVFWRDRLFTYTEPAGAVAFFVWDPKSQLVSLVPSEARLSASGEGSLSIEAKCSQVSPLGIDLRCESRSFDCSIFPVRFSCGSDQNGVTLNLTVYSKDKSDMNRMKPGFVTVTATPDVGEPTSLRLPCCNAKQ